MLDASIIRNIITYNSMIELALERLIHPFVIDL